VLECGTLDEFELLKCQFNVALLLGHFLRDIGRLTADEMPVDNSTWRSAARSSSCYRLLIIHGAPSRGGR
jgi:hypothetical protein